MLYKRHTVLLFFCGLQVEAVIVVLVKLTMIFIIDILNILGISEISFLTILAKRGTTRNDILTYLRNMTTTFCNTIYGNKLYNHNNRKFTLDDIIEYIPKDNKTFEDRNMKIIYGTRFSKVMRMSNTIHTLCVEPSESFAINSEIL